MARNKDRQFFENDSLNARDLGEPVPETEKPMFTWSQVQGDRQGKTKEAAQKWEPERPESDESDAPDLTEAEAPEEADREQPETVREPERDPLDIPLDSEDDNGPEDVRAHIYQEVRREEAEEAWNREAQRVEGGQYRRRQPVRDEEDQPARKQRSRKGGKKSGKGRKKKNVDRGEERRGFVKMVMIVVLCGFLGVMVLAMVASNFISSPLLALPRRLVTTLVTPLQTTFSGLTDSVVSYLRMLKIRGNIEYEYEQLLLELEERANDTATINELRIRIEQLEEELNEQKADESHTAMNPLLATVIGTVGNNYFSTLTLDKGTADGVTDYMAVVNNGGLVGVTYDTKEHSCSVRCIIDSDCSVAGLVQSSRDQGTVKGTLGTNGEPMCRMYYLPDNSLPRPGDVVVTSGVGLEFPKGIPIGYIRESTRGMESNKSYVVLEPVVDFQHLEYVTVYRYRPLYAEDAQQRTTTSQNITLETLATARPIPTFNPEGQSDFVISTSATAEAAAETATPAPETTATPAPTATPDPNATPVPANLEYHPVDRSGASPSPTPRPTYTPTPSPEPTPDAGAMTVEDDDE